MRKFVLALPFCFLGACAQTSAPAPSPTLVVAPTTPAATPSDPVTQIASFTVADLQAADADAVANNDVLSHACYPALIRFVTDLQGKAGSAQTVKGAFSAFQKARDLRRSVQGGLPDYLKLGCAPLVQDEATLLVKLGAIGAGTALIGPLAPAIGAGLPIPIQ